MGSSMAENHPVGFQWVMEAREKGAKVIHVDPRFTRTSAMADIWVPLRAGSDIIFLGALINYVLENNRDFREYVVHYTNAGHASCATTFGIPKTWTDSSPDGMPKRRNTIPKPGSIGASQAKMASKPDIQRPLEGTAKIAAAKRRTLQSSSPIRLCSIRAACSRC